MKKRFTAVVAATLYVIVILAANRVGNYGRVIGRERPDNGERGKYRQEPGFRSEQIARITAGLSLEAWQMVAERLCELTPQMRHVIASVSLNSDDRHYRSVSEPAHCQPDYRICIKNWALVMYPFSINRAAARAYLIWLEEEDESDFEARWAELKLPAISSRGSESLQEHIAEWFEHFHLVLNKKATAREADPELYRQAARLFVEYRFIDYDQYHRFVTEVLTR